MNHRQHLAADKAKKEQPEYNYELLQRIEEAVKDKADKRELKQGEGNGLNTED